MARHVTSYLRTHRLRWGLSCAELANLLGISKSSLIRYELELRPIPARVLVACELVFGVPGSELFPGFYEAIEDALMARALPLHARVADRNDPFSRKKQALLEAMPGRLSGRPVL